MEKLLKLAQKISTKLAFNDISDIIRIKSAAAVLLRNLNILEKSVKQGDDIYESVDNPEEANARVYRIRRIVHTLFSVANSMYEDATKNGLSEMAGAKYVDYLKGVLANLYSVPGVAQHLDMFKQLEGAVNSFVPRSIPKLNNDSEGLAYSAPKSDYDSFEGKLEDSKPSTMFDEEHLESNRLDNAEEEGRRYTPTY